MIVNDCKIEELRNCSFMMFQSFLWMLKTFSGASLTSGKLEPVRHRQAPPSPSKRSLRRKLQGQRVGIVKPTTTCRLSPRTNHMVGDGWWWIRWMIYILWGSQLLGQAYRKSQGTTFWSTWHPKFKLHSGLASKKILCIRSSTAQPTHTSFAT